MYVIAQIFSCPAIHPYHLLLNNFRNVLYISNLSCIYPYYTHKNYTKMARNLALWVSNTR